MSDNSTSEVGRGAIDAYLDSVEAAMLEAHAPRIDRSQVLADLESQIADMLAREPQPLTEAVVKAVIERLESPYHFAATYGNGKPAAGSAGAAGAESPRRFSLRGFSLGRFSPRLFAIPGGIRWSYVAATCFAGAILAGVLMLGPIVLSQYVRLPHGKTAGFLMADMLIALGLGFVATPCALGMAYQQLRGGRSGSADRDLVMKMLVAYAILAPALVITVLTEWTYGIVLVPFGIFGFIYLQAKLVRRFQRYLNAKLPPQGDGTGPKETQLREPAAEMGGGMAMVGV